MIFVSTGTQLPFDRFIEIIDRLAPELGEELVVQAIPDKYCPKNIKLLSTISHDRFTEYLKNSRLVISHAGMGTIITSMLMAKPLVIFPRIAALGEHRNEHQLATAARFEEMGYVRVARNEEELLECIRTADGPRHTIGATASDELADFVVKFVEDACKGK